MGTAASDDGVAEENGVLLWLRERPTERSRLAIPRRSGPASSPRHKEVLAHVRLSLRCKLTSPSPQSSSLTTTHLDPGPSSSQVFKTPADPRSFIHGGAWRDPRATFDEAEPTLSALLDPSRPSHHLARASSRVAGFASLNYRLAPHPDFAQDLGGTTPAFAARSARHPLPLEDVLSGLRFLQRRFGFGEDYVLSGHSAGGCLAYQVLLGGACLAGGSGDAYEDVKRPVAAVGFEGIYDLGGLNARMGGAYSSFMEAAFGPDVGGAWKAASPATAGGSYGAGWSEVVGGRGGLAVLAHSPGDKLVDMPECDAMEARLRADGVGWVLAFRDLEGGHFEVLRDGSFARVLRETWEELERGGGA